MNNDGITGYFKGIFPTLNVSYYLDKVSHNRILKISNSICSATYLYRDLPNPDAYNTQIVKATRNRFKEKGLLV